MKKFCQIFTKLTGRKKKEGESYRLKEVQGGGKRDATDTIQSLENVSAKMTSS